MRAVCTSTPVSAFRAKGHDHSDGTGAIQSAIGATQAWIPGQQSSMATRHDSGSVGMSHGDVVPCRLRARVVIR